MSRKPIGILAAALTAFCLSGAYAIAQSTPGVSPALEKRMADEKAARRACKIEICKAFNDPAASGDITCSVVKTFLRENITAKITGGSYVWGYGHTQCSAAVKMDRAALGKALKAGAATITLSKHTLNCNVDNKDPKKGKSFTVAVSMTPTVTFKDGKATKVDFGNLSSSGSNVASAAIGALQALDKVSGYVSRAAAKEVNQFLYSKCKADGITIKPAK